ncbi:PPC domain-containing protein [soil metagenome]
MVRLSRLAPAAWAYALFLLVPPIAFAQLPQHRLQGVFPPGGQAGSAIEIELTGADLEFVDQLWFDHPGIVAEHVEGAKFWVAIPPKTPIGHHDLRVVGPLGVSNPRTFVVGGLPESREAEPNNTPEQANPIPLNSVINGQINGATDVDCFAFEAEAGQRLLIEVVAARLDSRLDGTLRVYGPEGQEIVISHEGYGLDPFLDLVAPSSGRYVIKLHDVVYAGSPEHGYRLTLHDGPHIDAISPLAVEAGQEATFTLLGRNLGGEPTGEEFRDGAPLERLEVTITAPERFEPDPAHPGTGFVPSAASARRGFEYRWESPEGRRSNAVFIAEAQATIVIEQEPNDGGDEVQKIALPCDISGDFRTVGDVDVYRFEAKKDDVWWIEALAERIGSPADPMVVIQRVPEDGPFRDLANADDLADFGTGNRFSTASVDAALRWQVPEDGTYQVVVSDLFNTQKYDPRVSYRLVIRPEEPEFRLFLVPENAAQPEALTVRAGGRTSAQVLAWRLDGFAGPILVEVEAESLPAGVTCEPVVIGPGQTVAPIVFRAEPGADLAVSTVQLVGRGLSESGEAIFKVLDGTSPEGEPPARKALAGGITWPPAQANVPAPARLTRGFVVAVRPSAPFALEAEPRRVSVTVGGAADLTVQVRRGEGFNEVVQVNTAELPQRIAAASARIEKEQESTTLKLAVPNNVEPGVYTILLKGSGPFPFNKDPNAEEKATVNVVEPSNPITLVVKPAEDGG